MASYDWPTHRASSPVARRAERGSDAQRGSREPARGPRAQRRMALAAILCVALGCATMFQSFSWNQTSAYDLIQAISHGQTNIDRYQANTGDKAFYRGHWYSARAPGLALFSLPFYELLTAVERRRLGAGIAGAAKRRRDRGPDRAVGNVLPGLVLLILVWRVAERLQPGFGAATAVTLGLGTIALPLSTLLFAHILAACLGFAAFALLLRERDGPPRAGCWHSRACSRAMP